MRNFTELIFATTQTLCVFVLGKSRKYDPRKFMPAKINSSKVDIWGSATAL